MSVNFMAWPVSDRLGAGAASEVGCTLLSIVTGEPLRSFIWPVVTTTSPCFTPLSTATWSPRVSPVVTKV